MIGQFQPSDQATYTCVARNVYNDIVKTTSKIGEASNISLAHIYCKDMKYCYFKYWSAIYLFMSDGVAVSGLNPACTNRYQRKQLNVATDWCGF